MILQTTLPLNSPTTRSLQPGCRLSSSIKPRDLRGKRRMADTNKRRVQKGSRVSLQKFALGKFNNGLKRKREQNRVDNFKKSAALRKYAKLCKDEGIESKRVNVHENKSRKASVEAADNMTYESNEKKEKEKEKKMPKHKPFAREERLADERRRGFASQQERQAERELAIRKAKKEREHKKKMHTQRTRKGQPIINNQVKSLLTRIQNA